MNTTISPRKSVLPLQLSFSVPLTLVNVIQLLQRRLRHLSDPFPNHHHPRSPFVVVTCSRSLLGRTDNRDIQGDKL